jgi:hypothetical protein
VLVPHYHLARTSPSSDRHRAHAVGPERIDREGIMNGTDRPILIADWQELLKPAHPWAAARMILAFLETAQDEEERISMLAPRCTPGRH